MTVWSGRYLVTRKTPQGADGLVTFDLLADPENDVTPAAD